MSDRILKLFRGEVLDEPIDDIDPVLIKLIDRSEGEQPTAKITISIAPSAKVALVLLAQAESKAVSKLLREWILECLKSK